MQRPAIIALRPEASDVFVGNGIKGGVLYGSGLVGLAVGSGKELM